MRDKMIRSTLLDLNATSTDIEASALVSMDGLMMAAALPSNQDEDHVAAMSAAVLSIGERTALELARGELEQILIKGSKGYVLITHTGPEAVITVVAKPTARLGMIFLDVKHAAAKMEKLISVWD